MQITLITVGKLKEDYLKAAENHFKSLISKHYDFNFINIPDEKIQDGCTEAAIEAIKNKEGTGILKKIQPGQYVIALAIDGRQLNTEGFKKLIKDCTDAGKSNLVFVIGGSLGLSAQVLRRADYKISFSPMTFPHQLMKIMLMEQLSIIL